MPTKGEIDEEYDEVAPQPRDLPVVPDQIEVGDTLDGSHRDNFGESLETLSAVESQSWISY
jgi:hypothetical protein